jgi:cell division protein FtsB
LSVRGTQSESFASQMRAFLRRNITWFLAIALAWLLLQDVFGTHGVLAMHRSKQEAARVQKEIDGIDKENEQLEGGVKSLKSDPSAIEKIAREEIGLARPGEFIFKVTPKTNAPAGSAPASPDRTSH